MICTLPMFEVPDQPPVRPSPTVAGAKGSPRPKWTRYTAAMRLKCDDCMSVLAVEPTAPLARQARYERRWNGERRLLCPEHAVEWRLADNLPENLRGREGRT